MALITLQTLIDEAKSRVDMINSDFVSEAEWKSFINKGLGDLFDLLVANYGDDYFAKVTPSTAIVAKAGETALPDDFYKLIGIDVLYNGSWRPMNSFQFAEAYLANFGIDPRYCLQADKLLFRPENHSAMSIKITYVPEFTKLALLTDTFNFKSSWDDFVILKAALKARDKEEGDVTVLAAELAQAQSNIIKMAPNRDANRPKRIIDVESVSSLWP